MRLSVVYMDLESEPIFRGKEETELAKASLGMDI